MDVLNGLNCLGFIANFLRFLFLEGTLLSTNPDNPPLIKGKIGLNMALTRESMTNKIRETLKTAADATCG